MNEGAHHDEANVTNDFQNALSIINQFSSQSENWTSDIIINSIVLTTSNYQTLSREQICQLPATRNSVFKVMKETRKKYVLVLDPNRYCPSKVDWKLLYSDIKRQGNENGMNLIVGYGSFNKGAVSITCNRQRRYKNYKNFRDDYDGDQFSSNGFSPMSKAKSLRRSKQSEKKKPPATNQFFLIKIQRNQYWVFVAPFNFGYMLIIFTMYTSLKVGQAPIFIKVIQNLTNQRFILHLMNLIKK